MSFLPAMRHLYTSFLQKIFNTTLDRDRARTFAAFWLFGLINAMLYSVILSAALDVVGSRIPKGVVLLVDVAPTFLIKLLALPLNFHRVPYRFRIPMFTILSVSGMTLVGLTGTSTSHHALAAKMLGIILASVSSGGGDMSFLALTHYYGKLSIAAWSSGTGAAGLVASGVYVAATSWLKFTVRDTLLLFSLLPLTTILNFFFVLPSRNILSAIDNANSEAISPASRPTTITVRGEETQPLLLDNEPASSQESARHRRPGTNAMRIPEDVNFWTNAMTNIKNCRVIFYRFMLPLLLVYLAEYTINQGITPLLLYPLGRTPFANYRDFYPTYMAIYQLGAFVARSSIMIFKFYHLYFFSLFQFINLFLLLAQSMFMIFPSIYFIFFLVFWEGILGGLAYVNTFAKLADTISTEERELFIGAISASDSAGVFGSSFFAMLCETSICRYQVAHGVDLCLRV